MCQRKAHAFFFVKIDIRLVCLLISLMDRFKNIVGFYFTFSLLLLGLPNNLQAVDFNNTQVDQEVYEQAISWENLQDRNGVIFAPNAEEPLTGYIRKLYPNTQVEVLVRLSLGSNQYHARGKELYGGQKYIFVRYFYTSFCSAI